MLVYIMNIKDHGKEKNSLRFSTTFHGLNVSRLIQSGDPSLNRPQLLSVTSVPVYAPWVPHSP